MQPLVIVHPSKIVGKSNGKINQGLLKLYQQILPICYMFWPYYTREPTHQSSITVCRTNTSTPIKEIPNVCYPILLRIYLVPLQWEGNNLPIRKVTHAHFHHY